MSNSALEHYDIQAIFRGFGTTWPWARYFHCKLSEDAEHNRKFLRGLADALDANGPTTVRELDQNRNNTEFETAYNIALSHPGLSKLGVDPESLYSFPQPFIEGMKARATLIGDNQLSSPEYWEPQWQSRGVDLVIALYSRSEPGRETAANQVEKYLAKCGISEIGKDEAHRFVSGDKDLWLDDEESQPEPGKVLEHFGFQDGISNPPIRGLHSNEEKFPGSGKLDTKGHWHPLAAGEFLYGYTDEVGEIPEGPQRIDITHNGSYLVYRKLSQDVDRFRSYMKDTAKKLGAGEDFLAAKFVGRDRNGRSLVPDAPVGQDINNFLYEDDIRGTGCPLGAHARRANPRDTLGFKSMLVDRHRLLRRAITYGRPVGRDEYQTDVNELEETPNHAESFPGQGLLFLALNVDIDRQFEFIQSEWVNYGNDLNQGECRDPLIGAQEGGHMLLPREDGAPLMCAALPRFVETRGGDYFFLPGIRALAKIIETE